jgi:predicted Zn-dependent protease
MTDYAEPLILARKALATAEAYALHGDRAKAVEALEMALVQVNRCRVAMQMMGEG